MTSVPTKICTKCGIEKEATAENFQKNSQCYFGVVSTCKICRSRLNREWREANYEERRAREKLSESLIPKEVIRERARKFKEKNPDYHKEYSRQHYKDNVELYKKNHKKFKEKNPHAQSYYVAEYRKRKKAIDPLYEFTGRVRESVKRSLTDVNCFGSIRYLNYTPNELQSHIESQFKDGMSWDNRSEWHIDHIIPVSHFNYDSPYHPEFVFCWSLFNLQPLWAFDNISKNSRLDYADYQEPLLELLELVRKESIGYRSYKYELAA